jgi:hypothetical protein
MPEMNLPDGRRGARKKPLVRSPTHANGPLHDTLFATSDIVQGVIYEKVRWEQAPNAANARLLRPRWQRAYKLEKGIRLSLPHCVMMGSRPNVKIPSP